MFGVSFKNPCLLTTWNALFISRKINDYNLMQLYFSSDFCLISECTMIRLLSTQRYMCIYLNIVKIVLLYLLVLYKYLRLTMLYIV